MLNLAAFLIKTFLGLRYKVTVSGAEALRGKSGILLLPNHPAEIDPVLLSVHLWPLVQPQPVVLEFFYKLPVVNTVMRWIKAIPMPDMDYETGPHKRRRVQRALDNCVTTLKSGGTILIYPAGRLSVSGEEKLGAATGVAAILHGAPGCNVALVKIRGLYGSSFSKALTAGITTELGKTFLSGLTILLKNFVFFTPRRHVSIEITLNPTGFPRRAAPLELNKFLESWYNSPEIERPTLISRSFWRKDLPIVPPLPTLDLSTF